MCSPAMVATMGMVADTTVDTTVTMTIADTV
jgi:hypothetical protein